ncbi:MAG: M14 family metallopeptidase, partial [Bacteroidota bacterium]
MLKIIPALFLLVSVQVATSQHSFDSVFGNAEQSSREDIRIDFEDSFGNSGYLPVSVLKGASEGPVFTMVAGVHGYEYPPIMAVQELLQEIDPEELKGTIIVVPIANTASFFTRTPFINPQDKVNLNNAFPGKSDGSITYKLAHYITEHIIPISDVFLDIHGGDACEDLIPFVCYYNNTQKPEQTALAQRLSETSGFNYVVSYPYTITDEEPAKYAFKQAVQDGKTALSIECGKLGNVQQEAVELVKKGVYNMLWEMKMYGM